MKMGDELIRHLLPAKVFSGWCQVCNKWKYFEYYEELEDKTDKVFCYGRCYKCQRVFRTNKKVI